LNVTKGVIGKGIATTDWHSKMRTNEEFVQLIDDLNQLSRV
jgi:hypothetical protein